MKSISARKMTVLGLAFLLGMFALLPLMADAASDRPVVPVSPVEIDEVVVQETEFQKQPVYVLSERGIVILSSSDHVSLVLK